MNPGKDQVRLELPEGARVLVIGGGPAGSFFAIHLLRKARQIGRMVRVTIIERRRSNIPHRMPAVDESWKGCNYCAGGISPKLNDVLRDLGFQLREDTVQSRIGFITIQGFWKNIELEVPAGRQMYSVYRGSRPDRRFDHTQNFDSFLLDQALKAGAALICGEVKRIDFLDDSRPNVHYTTDGTHKMMDADMVVVAAGVNEVAGATLEHSAMLVNLRRLIPGFAPPTVRHALIFELQPRPKMPANLESTIHFVEYGSRQIPIEMCSLVPKRGFITVTLVGKSVDAIKSGADTHKVIQRFLELPHIRKLVSPGTSLQVGCTCRPNMVVRSAKNPFGHRIAAVGDLVTTRLYKDGILSAQRTALALAETVLLHGVDKHSLARGYGPILRQFRLNNAIAGIVFLLHRLFFSSSVLSRVLYQAVITERKTTLKEKRHLEKILWSIASGDDEYTRIFLAMLHPSNVKAILVGGALLTLRNYFTELLFGLRWEGFGRFTTGVAIERLQEKRAEFSRLIADASVSVPGQLEFERMYTIKIAAPIEAILYQLGRFGEQDRAYLRPRWVQIQRIAGSPNIPGCIVQYVIGHRAFSFTLRLEQVRGGHLAVYRVLDGFARGGVLVFEIEQLSSHVCALSIYVAFNFERGARWYTSLWRWAFRKLFPSFIHDVLWNHSLCELKDLVEGQHDTMRRHEEQLDGSLIKAHA